MAAIGLVTLLVAALLPHLAPQLVLQTMQRIERSRGGLSEHEVSVHGHQIRYVKGGPDGAPVLLLLHGFASNKDHWTRMAPYVTDAFRVIALDLPGFGFSTRNATVSYDITSQARRLSAFTEALKLPPHHVAGNSMGGHLAAVYASMYPEQILSAALFANAGIRAPRPSVVRRAYARGEEPLLVSSVEDFERVLGLSFVDEPFIPGPIKQHFAERAVENRAFNKKVYADLGRHPAPLEPLLGALDMPVLVLWGAQDQILDVSSMEVMRPLMPHAQFVVLKDCGHLPQIERAEESAGVYREFLKTARPRER